MLDRCAGASPAVMDSTGVMTVVSRHATTGSGCIIQRGAIISADPVVGDAVKISMIAQIHHDCRIGSFSTIGPGACFLGAVTVGE
jgi:UDP-3-O-[3-hydroxymyristoyl] glucosamine N-acyltransferase